MTALCPAAECLRPANRSAPPAAAETDIKHRGFTARLFRRLFDAVWDAHRRQAEREINRVVAWRAGPINDALEREIGERIFRGDWTTRT